MRGGTSGLGSGTSSGDNDSEARPRLGGLSSGWRTGFRIVRHTCGRFDQRLLNRSIGRRPDDSEHWKGSVAVGAGIG